MAELAVLIPTYGRAEKLAPLIENIGENTAISHRIYFGVEYGDTETRDALAPFDVTTVFGDFGSCARAMNACYLASVEPFVWTGNDDSWLHEGWDLAALDALTGSKHICGTNDGNDRMTCFALIRRSFIEQHSGVFDRPNAIYHEYASQYVDTELADYAKHRGVWTEAPDSLTEHLHHEFGKADASHPNYQKAQATCADDHAEYLRRKPLWESA